MQEPGRLATLLSHSTHPTRSVNIPSSPGGGDTSQGQETASMTDTCLTLLPAPTPSSTSSTTQSPDTQLQYSGIFPMEVATVTLRVILPLQPFCKALGKCP